MKLLLNSIFFCILFFCTHVFSKELLKTYTIKVGAIKIGKLDWEINIDDKKYINKLNLKSEGLLSAIYSFEGKYYSEGIIEKELLQANQEMEKRLSLKHQLL